MSYNSPPPLSYTFSRLKGKIVLVTGASSGIGAAATKLFAKEGATVIATARRKDRLDALVKEIAAEGFKAEAMECDVNNEEAVQLTINAIITNHGRLDGAFNNAGLGMTQSRKVLVCTVDIRCTNPSRPPLHEAKLEDFDRILSTNLRAVFVCMKYELKAMLETQGRDCSIVNTSSIAGLIGIPGDAIYSASKLGMAGLVKSAALDYARKGIRVNAVAPGPVNTPMLDEWLPTEEAREKLAAVFPMNYICDPDDVARAALFLLSEESRWTTGHVFPVEGGKSV